MKTKIFIIILLVIGAIQVNAQWQQLNGPYGGQIKSIAVNDSTVFATGYYYVYKSTDDGNLWTSKSFQNTQAVATKDSIVFVATFGNGVYKSIDNGETWNPANLGLSLLTQRDITLTNSLTCFAINGTKIYAGTYGSGIIVSSIDNVYWSAANNGITDWDIHSIAARDSVILAGTLTGVFVSTDYGSNWVLANTGITGNQWSNSFAFYGDTIFTGNSGDGLFKTTNYGTQWTHVDMGTPNIEVYSILIKDNNIFVGSNNGIFVSSDGGVTWNSTNNGIVNTLVWSIKAQGNNLYAGTRAGVYLSTDNGATWVTKNNGIRSTEINSLVVDNSNIYAGTSSGGFYSQDNGSSWSEFGGTVLANQWIYSLMKNGTNIFAGTYFGNGMYLSSDNCLSWSNVLSPYDIFSYAKNSTYLFSGTSNGVYKSSDNGLNWVHAGNLTSKISAIATIGVSEIFIGVSTGGVWKSTNNGTSWNFASTGLPSVGILSLAVNDTNIFVGTYGSGVYLSSNHGGSWTQVNNGLNNYNITELVPFYSKMVACTNTGVFVTSNNGANWTSCNDGFDGLCINTLTSDSTYIYVGTSGNGIWKRPLNDVVGIHTTQDNNSFSIYPNPTNNELIIESNSLSKQKFEIFNIVGQSVYHSIIDKIIKVDVSNFSNGIYFIKLNSETSSTIKKFVKE